MGCSLEISANKASDVDARLLRRHLGKLAISRRDIQQCTGSRVLGLRPDGLLWKGDRWKCKNPPRATITTPGQSDRLPQTWHKMWTSSGGWGSWENMGNACEGAPAAGSWGSNQMSVGCTGTDGSMMMKSWNGTGWTPSGSTWDNMGGSFVDDGA